MWFLLCLVLRGQGIYKMGVLYKMYEQLAKRNSSGWAGQVEESLKGGNYLGIFVYMCAHDLQTYDEPGSACCVAQ